MHYGVVLPAAGFGRRMGGHIPKQYLQLAGRPVICHTLDRFRAFEHVVVAVEAARVDAVRAEIFRAYGYPGSWQVVAGGAERQDSVAAGLAALPASLDVVLVHDAVRPFVTTEQIHRLCARAHEMGGAILAVPVKDTIKRSDESRQIIATVDRAMLWRAQTPQAFRAELLRKAIARAQEENFLGTDEASLVERLGASIELIEGSEMNIKITRPEDVIIAQAIADQWEGP